MKPFKVFWDFRGLISKLRAPPTSRNGKEASELDVNSSIFVYVKVCVQQTSRRLIEAFSQMSLFDLSKFAVKLFRAAQKIRNRSIEVHNSSAYWREHSYPNLLSSLASRQ